MNEENQVYFIDSDQLPPAALERKHKLEQDPSFRTDYMKYLDDMEIIDSDIKDKVLKAMDEYDYDSYTAADVERALSKDTCNIEDFKALLREGADKISINSAAISNPQLIADAAEKFGSQCVVVAIDARRRTDGAEGWTVYKNGGRIDTGLDAVEWARKAQELGAGEILLTSMDCDGTKAGYDIPLTRAIAQNVSIPVIASGGAGKMEHFKEALTDGMADAALAASLFHYKELEIGQVKEYLQKEGVAVRWQ